MHAYTVWARQPRGLRAQALTRIVRRVTPFAPVAFRQQGPRRAPVVVVVVRGAGAAAAVDDPSPLAVALAPLLRQPELAETPGPGPPAGRAGRRPPRERQGHVGRRLARGGRYRRHRRGLAERQQPRPLLRCLPVAGHQSLATQHSTAHRDTILTTDTTAVTCRRRRPAHPHTVAHTAH